MRNFKIKILNKSGMSMVEIMVVMVVMSLIGIGSATLMNNMFSMQKRGTTKAFLFDIKEQFKATLKNNQAWENTINAPVNAGALGCLTAPAGCPNGDKGSFRIFDAFNNPFFIAEQATRGFTLDGNACNTFSMAGNSACPFRYDIALTTRCTNGSATCRNPKIIITGTARYRPDNVTATSERMDASQYDFVVHRPNLRMSNESFSFAQRNIGNDPGCGPSWQTAPLNTELFDNGNLANLVGNEIRVQPGRYYCEVMAQAFDVRRGFKVRLFQTGAVAHPIGNGYSSNNESKTVVGHAYFEILAPTNFRIEYFCNNHLIGNELMGAAVGANNVYRSIYCMSLEAQ